MRIGIYGGSFNPPHEGHVLAAQELIRLYSLDRLFVIPTYLSPHKPQPQGSPDAYERLALTQLAFAPVKGAQVLDIEILRQGVSYTVDTLEMLRAQFPDDELFLLMGTDMLLSFPDWRCPDKIAAMATLAVMHRQSEDAQLRARVKQTAQRLERELGARVIIADNRSVEVSSTEVRRMLAFGVTDYRLSKPVSERIAQTGLYGCRDDRRGLDLETLQAQSLALHDEKRRGHVAGCCQTARDLAERWGEDENLAMRAALLHDVTKALGPEAHLALCAHWQVTLTDFEQTHPKLLHAKTGAAAARHVFGECEAVCGAIEWHTTGKPDMTKLEKILYIADYVEPTRRFDGVEHLRALAEADLDAAVCEGLQITMDYVRAQNQPVDPTSAAALQFLKGEGI